MRATTDVLTLLKASFMVLDVITQQKTHLVAKSRPKSPMWILCLSAHCSSFWSQGTNVISVSLLHLAIYFLNTCKNLNILEASITVKLIWASLTESRVLGGGGNLPTCMWSM